jgi:toxin HigB-1
LEGELSIGKRACLRGLAPRNLIRYTPEVAIRTFRHKGLKRFFAAGSKAGIQPEQASRLRLILGVLNAATEPRDLSLPGLRLHELRGQRRGTWSVAVSGNWRVTFSFGAEGVEDVDYEDYH